MKHKIVKIAGIAAAASIAVGGVCLGAGLAMGGSPSFYYDKDGIHVKENADSRETPDYVLEYTGINAVDHLDLCLEDAELRIVSGKEWAVEYVLGGWHAEPEYSLEGKTLTIRESAGNGRKKRTGFGLGHYWWYDGGEDWTNPYVKLTIPDTGKLEQVTINSEFGDVSIEKKLKAENVCVNAANGSVRMDGWEGKSIAFDMEYGNLTTGDLKGSSVTVKNESGEVKTGSLKADAVEIDMDFGSLSTEDMEGKSLTVNNESGTVKMGALQVEHADFALEYGDLTATVQEALGVDVDSDSGSVTLELAGGMEKYGVSLHSDWGTIRTPQGIVETGGESGADFIRMTKDTAGIRIVTEYGDIRVRDAL